VRGRDFENKNKNKFRDEILKQTKNLNRTILMNINKIRLQRNLIDNNTKMEMTLNSFSIKRDIMIL
jgi:hypothetical protein